LNVYSIIVLNSRLD